MVNTTVCENFKNYPTFVKVMIQCRVAYFLTHGVISKDASFLI